MTVISRRHLLGTSLTLATAGLASHYSRFWPSAQASGLQGLSLAREASRSDDPILMSAADDQRGKHYLVATSVAGEPLLSVRLPSRAHDICLATDSPYAFVLSRRPGRTIYVLDIQAGKIISEINSPPGFHLYGHGVFNREQTLLFVSENDYQHKRGSIGIYDVRPPFPRVGGISSGGIGPHQLAMLNHQDILVIANGGIETHPDSGRTMLNLISMVPNLTCVEASSGAVTSSFHPPHHQMSLRHLAVTANDTVVVGVQDHASIVDPDEVAPLVLRCDMTKTEPLVTERRPEEIASANGRAGLQPLVALPSQWRAMEQYIASVAVSTDGNWALTTTPRGGMVSLWDLTGDARMQHHSVKDVAGAVWHPGMRAFLVSNGIGQLLAIAPGTPSRLTVLAVDSSIRWDNHLTLSS